MKKIKALYLKFDKFVDSLPLWGYFLFNLPFWIGLAVITQYFSVHLLEINPEKTYDLIIMLKVGIIMSILVSFMVTLVQAQCLKSTKFWNAAKIFEEKLNAAATKKEVLSLHIEYNLLCGLVNSPIHGTEVNRLRSLIEMKQSLIK